MKTIQLSDKDLEQLKGLIDLFKEIDGDEDKSLELEDFFSFAEIGRAINCILEPILTKQ